MADHDSGYKLLFSHPRMVEELLRDFVREDWISSLDFRTLKKVGGSFVSDDLRERHSDTIWRLRSKGPRPRWFYVYLLLEFQSTPDPFMALRMMGYVALLHTELIRNGVVTATSGLPTVVPLVLYNGRRPWNAPLDLASLFRTVPPGAEHHVPQLRYSLIDENRLLPEELARQGSRVATLFQLEICSPRDLPRLTAELATLLPRGKEERLRHAFTTWLLRLLRRMAPGAIIQRRRTWRRCPCSKKPCASGSMAPGKKAGCSGDRKDAGKAGKKG